MTEIVRCLIRGNRTICYIFILLTYLLGGDCELGVVDCECDCPRDVWEQEGGGVDWDGLGWEWRRDCVPYRKARSTKFSTNCL